MKLQRITTPLLFAAALLAGAAHAQTAAPVAAEGAWARASVPGQKATGAFMRLTASEATRLVRAESPAAGVTEVHEMKMDAGVMKMAEVKGGLEGVGSDANFLQTHAIGRWYQGIGARNRLSLVRQRTPTLVRQSRRRPRTWKTGTKFAPPFRLRDWAQCRARPKFWVCIMPP